MQLFATSADEKLVLLRKDCDGSLFTNQSQHDMNKTASVSLEGHGNLLRADE